MKDDAPKTIAPGTRSLLALYFASLLSIAWYTAEVVRANETAVVDATRELLRDDAARIARRFTTYEYGLRGARGAAIGAGFAALSRDRFLEYIQSRDLRREFPGARGYGVIARVLREDEPSWLAKIRERDFSDFKIRELQKNSGDRFVIRLIEPIENNREALGLDLASEENRRSTAIASANVGETRLTAPIKLVQAESQGPGMLIMLPVYPPGVSVEPQGTTALQVEGWVYAPLVVYDVLDGLFAAENGYTVRLRDLDEPEPSRLLFEAQTKSAASQPLREDSLEFEVYGRRWQVAISVWPEYVARLALPDPLRRATLWALFSTMIFGVIHLARLATQRRVELMEQAERLAAQRRVMELDLSLQDQYSLQDNATFSMIMFDGQGRVSRLNRAARELLGYNDGETLHSIPMEKLFAIKTATGDHAWQERLEHQHRLEQEGELIARDGSRIAAWIVLSLARPELGRAGGIVGMAHDLREKKLAETQFEAMVEAAPYALIVVDRSRTILRVNHRTEQVFGYGRDEIVGSSVDILIPVEHRQAHHGLVDSYFENASDFRMGKDKELYGIKKNGEHVPLEIALSVVDTPNGRWFLASIIDISHQKAQQDRLMATSQRLQLAASSVGFGVWEWDLRTQALWWDEQMYKLYFLDPGTGAGHYDDWANRVHPEDLPRAIASLQSAVAERKAYDTNFRVVGPSGEVRHIHAHAVVCDDAQGQPAKMVGVNRDVTAKALILERLESAKTAAEAANRAKSEFLANMSHEIRTPMNAILGLLQLLQQTPMRNDQADYVDKTANAARSLLNILNDILDFSRVEAGKMVLDPRPFSLEKLLRELAVIIGANLNDKPVEVAYEVDLALNERVVGDGPRLLQVLINLATNALKFTHRGEIVICVAPVAISDANFDVEFSVRDTGIGMSEEETQRIFKGFVQANAATTRRYGGSGLGLAISQHLVGLMGGTIRVESEVGKGSTFRFSVQFPRAENRQGKLGAATQNDGSQPQKTALVVEDNESSRRVFAHMLENLGYVADAVETGREAVEKVNSARANGRTYGLILLDFALPDVDGHELAQMLASKRPETERTIVLLVSAHSRQNIARSLLDDQNLISGFLLKPVTPGMLSEAIERANVPTLALQPNVAREESIKKRLAGHSILLVEDNATNQLVAMELLRREGANVSVANNGKEAIACLESGEFKFDLVLMDLQMPEMDGFEATRRLRQELGWTNLPIVAMTANALPSDREAIIAAGMNDHVAKPFELDALVAAILAQTFRRAGHQGTITTVCESREVASTAAPTLSVLDTSAALSRLGGATSIYVQVLQTFLTDAKRLLDAIVTGPESGESGVLARTLHTLKGLAGTVGAETLGQWAAQNERNVGTQGISTLSDQARLAMREIAEHTFEAVRTYLAQQELGSNVVSVAAAAHHSPLSDLVAELQKLHALLQTSNLAALNLAVELPAANDPPIDGELDALRNLITSLDFPAATKCCTGLLARLGS